MGDLPQSVLKGISWSFNGNKYPDRTMFENDLLDSQDENVAEREPVLRGVVLGIPEVEIAFEPWDDKAKDRVAVMFTLRAASPEGFTGLELMYGIHNGIAGALSKSRRMGDHTFFEGLKGGAEAKGAPRYWVTLGS